MAKKKSNPEEGKHIEFPDPDPPEEVAVGPRLLTPEEWEKDWAEGITAMAERWKRRVSRPKKDPIKAGIAAEDKYADRLREAIAEKRRAKKLEKVGFEGWAEMVAATEAREFSEGALKRRPKFRKITDALQALRLYMVSKLDAMPTATDAQRERKLLAARKCQLIIGRFAKGVITDAEARREIDTATATR